MHEFEQNHLYVQHLVIALCHVMLLANAGADYEKFEKPPPAIPPHLRECFSRCGSIGFEEYFVDDSFGGAGSHFVFKRPQLDAMIASALALRPLPKRDKIVWACPWRRVGVNR